MDTLLPILFLPQRFLLFLFSGKKTGLRNWGLISFKDKFERPRTNNKNESNALIEY